MKFSPDELKHIVAVLDAKTQSFVELSKLAGLDPVTDFRGADLRFVNFGDDDLSEFDFRNADLRGADLSGARGLSNLKIDNSTKTDNFTRTPVGWPKPSDQMVEPDCRGKDGSIDDPASPIAQDATYHGYMPGMTNYMITRLEHGDDAIQLLLDGEAIPADLANETIRINLNWESFDHRQRTYQDRARQFIGFHRLSELGNLKEVTLDNAQIADLSALESCARIVKLSLRHCVKIQSVSPLSMLVELQALDLTGTSVRDLSPLANLLTLQRLSLGSSSITDISPLHGLSNLVQLDISYTAITDISPLFRLKKLSELNLRNSKVGDNQRRQLAHGVRLIS